MDFLFGSMVDVEFDKALDAAFERLDKMPADAFVQQALMRSGGPIAGLSAAAVEGPAAFNTIKLSFYFQRDSDRWFDHHFNNKVIDWSGALREEGYSSFIAANDDDYALLLAA